MWYIWPEEHWFSRNKPANIDLIWFQQNTVMFNCIWWWTNIVQRDALLEHIKEVDNEATNISRILAVKSLQGKIMTHSKILPEYNQKEQWDKIYIKHSNNTYKIMKEKTNQRSRLYHLKEQRDRIQVCFSWEPVEQCGQLAVAVVKVKVDRRKEKNAHYIDLARNQLSIRKEARCV